MSPSPIQTLSTLRPNQSVSKLYALLIGCDGPRQVRLRDGRRTLRAILLLGDSVRPGDDRELAIWDSQSLHCASLRISDIVELRGVRTDETTRMKFTACSYVRRVFEENGSEVERLMEIKRERFGDIGKLHIRARELTNRRSEESRSEPLIVREENTEIRKAAICWLRVRRTNSGQVVNDTDAVIEGLLEGIRVRCESSGIARSCEWRKPMDERSCRCGGGTLWRFGDVFLGILEEKETIGRLHGSAIETAVGLGASEVWKDRDLARWAAQVLMTMVGETVQLEMKNVGGLAGSGVEREIVRVLV